MIWFAPAACCRKVSSIVQFLPIRELGPALPWLSDKPWTCLKESEKNCSSSGWLPGSLEEAPEGIFPRTPEASEPGLAKAKAVAKRSRQEETEASSPTLLQVLSSPGQMVDPFLLRPNSCIRVRLRNFGESYRSFSSWEWLKFLHALPLPSCSPRCLQLNRTFPGRGDSRERRMHTAEPGAGSNRPSRRWWMQQGIRLSSLRQRG